MVRTRTIAVVLIVAGALAFAFPSLASEAFNTERPTSFSIGSEDDALLAAEETGNTVRNPGGGDPTVVGTLRNNFDSEVSITYRVRTTDGSIEPNPQRDSVTLRRGGSADITVQCAPPGQGGGGSGTAVVTAVVESAQADGISLENAEFDFRVQYNCTPPAGGGDGGDGSDGSDEDGEDEGDEGEEKDKENEGKEEEDGGSPEGDDGSGPPGGDD